MSARTKPTSKELWARYDYDLITGILTRKPTVLGTGRQRSVRTRWAGTPAGTTRVDGYIHVKMDGRSYGAHCIIWCMMTGEWPMHHVDHEDLNKASNAWDNLRAATPSQNRANTRPTGRLNAKGVSMIPGGRYRARIKIEDKQVSLGCFDTIDQAKAAYAAKALPIHGDFLRL